LLYKEEAFYLFQESLPPVNSKEEPQESRRKRNSRESDSRERLTEKPAAEKPPIDLTASIADCCCIGPRSRLPLPRIPPMVSSSCTTTAASSSSTSSSLSCPSIVVGGYPSRSVGVTTGDCSPPLPASAMGVAETTPTLANNSRDAVQTSVGNFGSASQQQQHQAHYHHHYQQQYPQTAAAAVTSSYSSSTTTPSLSSTSLGYSSGVPTTTQTVSVPRQLAQWTKHQTLKLQVLASVDRAPRSIDRSIICLFSRFVTRG
jgi:hypothetical protein